MVSSGQPMRRTVMLTAVDGGFTSIDTCPDSQMSQGRYTATPTTLTISCREVPTTRAFARSWRR